MIRRILAIGGSAIFLVLAPGFVAGMVPWWISHWRVEAALLGLPALRFLGGVLLALGAVGILDSFSRFAIQGIGTPAPVFPTRHLAPSARSNPTAFEAVRFQPPHPDENREDGGI